jgi:phage virion morphogenesis protein
VITIESKVSQKQLDRLLDKLANPTPALEEIGQGLQKSTKERISTTKVSPDGRPFAPWSFRTMLAREKEGTSANGILFRQGRLHDSIQYQVVGKQVQVGSDESAKYARFLQFGTPKMPARTFIGFSAQDIEMIRGVLKKHIRNG